MFATILNRWWIPEWTEAKDEHILGLGLNMNPDHEYVEAEFSLAMSQTILNLQTFANCPRWSYLVPNLPISDYLFIFVVQTVHIECQGDGIIEFHSILGFCYFLYHPVSSNLTGYLGNCLQPLLKNIYKGNMYVDPTRSTRKMMIYFSIFLVLLSVAILWFQWFQFLVPHPKVVWTCETAPSWWTLMSFAPAVELRWIRKKNHVVWIDKECNDMFLHISSQ